MFYLVQCDPLVPPGLYGEALRQRDIPHRLVRLDQGDSLPDIPGVTGALVLGGNMSVDDSTEFPFLLPLMAWMRYLTEAEIPLLAICLGAQLLARVLGGRVYRNQRGERGIHQVQAVEGHGESLLAGLPEKFSSLQWHQDSFDPPPGARLLASSAACSGQAFRAGRCSYGLQFHPEADLDITRAWNRRAGLDEAIPEQFLRCRRDMSGPALRLFDNFLALCGVTAPLA